MNTEISRRAFFSESTRTAAGLAAASAAVAAPGTVLGANDRINIAILGIRGRGKNHYAHFAKIPGVRVAALCDIDENLFKACVQEVEKLQGVAPRTFTDLRKMMEDKDIDAVSVANTNHWHSLSSIWAVQAGKDVYVEKPVSHNIFEGRKLVEAASKYKRIVQTGSQYRSNPMIRSAIEFVQGGGIGKVYMAKSVVYRGRASIGRGKVTEIPPGVNFDLWLGPAPKRAFIDNRFHYNWHWYWDTGNGETGNNGPHSADMIRWALNLSEHPRRVQSMGGMYIFDSDQETPNTQMSCLEYAGGVIVQLEVRNLYTNLDGDVREGVIFFGSQGRVEISLNNGAWASWLGRENKPGPGMTRDEAKLLNEDVTAGGMKADPHFVNFIQCMRSRKAEDLAAPIIEGHMAASICHLCNIAYRTGKTLTFDSKTESFPGDRDAQALVSREYRKPYVVPERV